MTNLKIFLVEEDTQEALNIKKTLKSFGYSVLWVASHKEDIVARARDLMPDLIIMDLSLRDNLEFFHAPEEMENLNLPIIYLTSSAHWENIVVGENKSTDPDSYLIKPYDEVELKYAIELAIYKNFKKLKNYYKAIFEHTGTATIIIEENTTISLANSEFENLSGYTREKIEGKKSWTEFAAKEDLDKMKEYHRLRRIDPASAPLIYDFRFLDRQGTVKNVHMNIGMIPGTNKSVASILDVTEHKTNYEKIHELHEIEKETHGDALNAKQQVLRVLERITDSIIALDNNWHFTYVNKKAAEIFGKTPEEMIGQHIGAMFPEGVDQPFYEAYQEAMEKQIHVHLEEYCTPYERWFESDIYPSEDGITILFKEITKA